MNIVSGDKADLPHGLYADLGTYRHEVFIELLGWELDTPTGIEQDQFDRQDTVYVILCLGYEKSITRAALTIARREFKKKTRAMGPLTIAHLATQQSQLFAKASVMRR